MRKIDESRAANYIRKHSIYKKWLAFVLCLSLLTGTITLYILNKPATAMTEEGAESVGLILETADAEYEQQLIEETMSGDGENTDVVDASEPDVVTSEVQQEVAEENTPITEEANNEEKENTENTEKTASDLGLDIPDSVNVADYVTSTVIERRLEDGTWEIIAKEDVVKGDYIRITYNYDLPDEAKLSDDIKLEIPKELDFVDIEKTTMLDGSGNAELTDEGGIKIEFNEEVKQEIIDEAKESGFQASAFDSFFNLFAPLKVYAADGQIATEGTANSGTDTSSPGMTVTYAEMIVNGVTYKSTDSNIQKIEADENDEVKFNADFVLGVGTISSTNNTFSYDLSQYGIIPSWSHPNGKVYRDGVQIGTFEISRDADGSNAKVNFTINPEFAKLNETLPMTGDFSFNASVKDNKKESEDEVVYKLSDDVTFKVKVITGDNSDISVDKIVDDNKGGYNESNGTIAYRIKVSSKNGSGGIITLNDVMSVQGDNELTSALKATSINTFTVTKYSKDGTATSKNVSVTRNDNTFTMSLEKLDQEEYYIVEYTYKLPDTLKNQSKKKILENKASVKSDETIEKTSIITTDIEGNQPYISKKATVDDDNHEVTWTIILNENKKNLKGYTLKDIIYTKASDGYNDVLTPFSGEMTFTSLTDGTSFKKNITDGVYKFEEDDYNTYKITYKYNYSDFDLVYGKLVNEASIRLNPDKPDSGNTVKAESDYLGQDVTVIDKKNNGLSVNGDGTVTVSWKVTLKAPIVRNEGADNKEYWTFYDEIADSNEVIEESELERVYNLFAARFGKDKVVLTKGNQCTIGDSVTGYKNYSIVVKADLKDNDFEVEYDTKGYIGDGLSQKTFENTAYVFSKNYKATDKTTYEPMLMKYDGQGNAGDSEYEYYTDTLYQSGILTWKIKVSVPALTDYETLKITEILPKDVELITETVVKGETVYGLEVADNDSFNNAENLSDGSASLGSVSFTKAFNSEGNIVISFDTQNALGKTYYFRVRAKIKSDYDWGANNNTGYFNNTVYLHDEKDNKLGFDTQGQTITKTETALSKKGNTVEGKINTLEYELDVNPGAANLFEKGDEITLRDSMETRYTVKDGANHVSVKLVEGSLKVYYVPKAEDGTDLERVELDSSKYSYKLSSTNPELLTENDQNGATYSVINDIELTIPDNMHIVVAYDYYFSGQKNANIYTTNTATLDGIAIEKNTVSVDKALWLQDAEGHLNAKGIELYKVDADNYNIYLSGASFALYKYDADADDFKDTKLTFTTGTGTELGTAMDGHVSISDLDYNTAYYLEEIKEPEGYIKSNKKLYFCIMNDEGEQTAYSVPKNFEDLGGKYLSGGSDVLFENEKEGTSITLHKDWVYEDNTDNSVQPDSVEVVLGRRYGSLVNDDSSRYWNVNIVRRDASNGGKSVQSIGLPSVENGSVITFEFSVWNGQWTKQIPDLYINGDVVDFSEKMVVADKNQRVSWSTKITENTEINLIYSAGTGDESMVTYSISSPDAVSTTGSLTGKEDDSFSEAVTLTGPDWTRTVDTMVNSEGKTVDLPKYEYVKKDDGTYTKYKWLYFAKEVRSYYYDDSYSDDQGGIASGTITITNTRNHTTPYTLPKTGGIGEGPIKTAGIGFIGFALVGGIFTYTRNRKKKDKVPA